MLVKLARRVAAAGVGAVLALASVQAAHAAPQHAPFCAPTDVRTFTSLGATWYAFDSGTLNNRSAGTITQSYAHTTEKSLTTTVSAEVGLKVSALISEVNVKFGLSAAVTAKYSKTTTFTVAAPPHTTIHFRNGILRRAFSVTRVRRDDTCIVTTTHGTAAVADSAADAW
jgi:hypothetical protein